MHDLQPAPRASSTQEPTPPSASNTALRTMLGQGGVLLLFGLLAGAGHNPNAYGSAYGLLGLFLMLIVLAAIGLAVALVYGVARRSVLAALSGSSLGTLVGGFVAAMLLLTLPEMKMKAASDVEATARAIIIPYNHTPDYIHQFFINDQSGGNSRAYGGGGSSVCCIRYPRQWHPGLTATVRWTTSDSNPDGSPEETWHEKVVPIESYEESGTRLNVHFLPQGEVRLIIWNEVAGWEGYPGPGAPKPPPDWPPWLHEQNEPKPPAKPGQHVPLPPPPASNGGAALH